MNYFYLHGFASSPRSTKAQQLLDRFQSIHLSLEIPDLNQNDFQHLTLTRQIQQVKSLLTEEPVTLIGSSFGGLTAAWIAQDCHQVDRIVLLAPAFRFLGRWLPTFTPRRLRQWEAGDPILVYHYGEGRSLPLNYGIVADLWTYDERWLEKPIPTLIFHGIQDETIPIVYSKLYASSRSWVKLIALESDHGLLDQEEVIWRSICEFCSLM